VTPDLHDIVVRRVGRPFVIEAIRMLEAGEGSVGGIDTAMEGRGYEMGPFRRLDEVGLDEDLAISRDLHASSPGSGRFDPPSLQVELVVAGRIGHASGRGFYRYDVGSAPRPDVDVEVGPGMSADAVVERLQLGLINEAYRMVEEGLASPPTIDAAMRADGHPQGPFELVDGLGLRQVIDRLRATYVVTESRSDDQYRVATALWQLATV
jgi:3-hydroxyacyl-CoA dehydrogenase